VHWNRSIERKEETEGGKEEIRGMERKSWER